MKMAADRHVWGLAEQAYDAVLDPSRWLALLDGLAKAVGGDRPMLLGHNLRGGAGALNVTVDVDAASIRAYADYYSARNVWLNGRPSLLFTGSVRTSQMMCARDVLNRSEFYNDYLKPQDIGRGLGATILNAGSYTYNLTIMRPLRASDFGRLEVAFVRRLLPHLERAMEIHRHIAHLQLHRRAQAEALDRMPAGLILVDDQLRVLFANRQAQQVLDADDGLRVFDGQLRTGVAADAPRFESVVREAAAQRGRGRPSGGGVMRLQRRSMRPSLPVLVTSLALGEGLLANDPPAAVVFVFDPATGRQASTWLLVELYGLTRAEARLVARLLDGDSVDAAATKLQVTVNTARTHLKRALAKTGAGKQAELIRMVLSGPAGLRNP